MARFRVYGPYPEQSRGRTRFRVRQVRQDGAATVASFETEAEASAYATACRRQHPDGLTVEAAVVAYQAHLEAKGSKPSTIAHARKRIGFWLDGNALLSEFTPVSLARIYALRVEAVAAASHQSELGQVKRFCAWLAKEGHLPRNPADGLERQGRPNKGKLQLRTSEAEKFAGHCLELAAGGDPGALAALMGLYLGMRPGEVLARVARDVDAYADGVRLWIDQGKTENAQRWLEVPEPLAALLQRQVEGLEPLAPLFPGKAPGVSLDHRLRWLRRRLEKLCDGAGVPRVCPHALRGTHSTLARAGGASGQVVAAQLGHGSERITEQHYLAPGTKRRAEQKGFKLVAGGKK